MMYWMTTQVSACRPIRKPCSHLAFFVIIFWALLFSGCVAQKADLAAVQRDLEDQIKRINQEKQDLEGIISKNREDSESLQAQQDAAMKDLFRARAEIRQELKALREADLTTLTGDIEEVNFRLTKIRQDLDAQVSQTDSRFQPLETQVGEQGTTLAKHDNSITSNQGQLTAFISQIDQDSQTRNQQVSEFQSSLSSFKESMAGLGNQLVQETERANQANTELRSQLDQKIDGLTTTVASLETQQASLESEVQNQKTNIQKVSTSTSQIRGALEKSGTLVGGQVTTMEASLNQLETHVNTLTEKLNADTQALRTYLEQDVKASINSMAETVANQQRPLVGRLDTVQNELQGLETQTQSNTAQVQELSQTVLVIREKQQLVGGLLGDRGDKLMQESGRITERLNLLEVHQSDLTQKMDTNTQSTTSHLGEVNTSLASVTQALENTSAALATRLDSQEQQINSQEQQFNSLAGTLQEMQQVKGEMEANLTHLNQLTQTINQLRDVVDTIGTKLGGRVDLHESRLAELAKRVNLLSSKGKKKK